MDCWSHIYNFIIFTVFIHIYERMDSLSHIYNLMGFTLSTICECKTLINNYTCGALVENFMYYIVDSSSNPIGGNVFLFKLNFFVHNSI